MWWVKPCINVFVLKSLYLYLCSATRREIWNMSNRTWRIMNFIMNRRQSQLFNEICVMYMMKTMMIWLWCLHIRFLFWIPSFSRVGCTKEQNVQCRRREQTNIVLIFLKLFLQIWYRKSKTSTIHALWRLPKFVNLFVRFYFSLDFATQNLFHFRKCATEDRHLAI